MDSSHEVTRRRPSEEQRRWQVTGSNHFGAHEIGWFYGRSSAEAIRECRRRKGHLCGGLKLEAEARL